MNEEKFDIGNKAVDLMQYTLQITSNRKRFPVKHTMLVQRIQEKCMDIYEYVLEANRTNLQNAKNQRMELQTKAITSCDKLSCYIEISLNLNLIGSDTVNVWQKKINDVKYMTIAWRSNDKNR